MGGTALQTRKSRNVEGRTLRYTSLKKSTHLQLVGELRTREYEKEYGSNKKKFTINRRVCEVALESILKLDPAQRHKR